MSYTSTVSATIRQFRLVFRKKTFTDGPTSARWSKLLSWGATGVLGVQAVFREYILCEYSQYLGVLYCGYSILQAPKYFGFDSGDTPALAVLLLLILPVLAVFRPSVLLILTVLTVFRPSVLLILPVLAVRNVLDTPSILEVRSILLREHL